MNSLVRSYPNAVGNTGYRGVSALARSLGGQAVSYGAKYVGKKAKEFVQNSFSNKRRHTTQSGRKSAAGSRADLVNESSANSRRAAAGKKRSVKKNKKTPKVSKAFSKKVKSALEKKCITGVFSETSYGSINLGSSNKQGVFHDNMAGTQDGNMFDPFRVLDAASVLWNKKVPDLDHNDTVGNFPQQNFNINVVSSYSKWHFKNNTQHTITLDIYECMTKGPRSLFSDPNPRDSFVTAVNDDTNNFIAIPSINAYDGLTTLTVNHLGVKPGMTSSFSKYWKYTSREVILDPGQSFTHIVNGPKNTTYEFNKFYQEGIMFNYQPGKTVSMMIIMKSDLRAARNGDASVGTGRYFTDEGKGRTVAIERYDHYVLGLPEQAGFTYPTSTTSGTVQALTLRKRVYSHNIYTNGPNLGGGVTDVRIDELNSAQAVNEA